MRTTATGFLISYVVVGLFITPLLLWAVHVTPNYTSGVAMVQDLLNDVGGLMLNDVNEPMTVPTW